MLLVAKQAAQDVLLLLYKSR